MLVVGSGDAPVPSDSDVVSNAELFNAADAAADINAPAADAKVVDNTTQAADEPCLVSADAAVKKVARGSSLAFGLSTGHFDVANVKLLRTCSEPDLSHLSRRAASAVCKSEGNSREHSNSRDNVHDDFTVDIVSCTFSPLLQDT